MKPHVLVDHLAVGLFSPFTDDATKQSLIRRIRSIAVERLALAARRTPRYRGDLADVYQMRGLTLPPWNLDDNNDDAVEFCIALRAAGASPSEMQAATLLRACVDVQETGLNAQRTTRVLLAFRGLDDDLTARGAKFSTGRRTGTVSKVRKAVQKVLKRTPGASAAEVWAAIAAHPPKGVAVIESPRLGKYIETDGAPDTGYARFRNIVSEERQE